jgi:hypothetical protein
MAIKRITLAILLGAVLLLVPGIASAQRPERPTTNSDILLRVNGSLRIGPDESADVVVVIHGDARVEGSVRDTLVVIRGDATISGSVRNDVVVIDGRLDLQPAARVGDVTLIGDSTLTQADGSRIEGSVTRRSNIGVNWHGFAFFTSFIFWLGLTLLTLAAGMLFAAVAGRQMSRAGALLTGQIGGALLAMCGLWIGIPVLAVLALFTIVGIPLAIATVVVLLPALGFLGYLVTGSRIGALVLRQFGMPANPEHPYLAALIGLLLLRCCSFIPIAGFLIELAAGLAGAGALVLLAWRAWRGTPGGGVEAVAA